MYTTLFLVALFAAIAAALWSCCCSYGKCIALRVIAVLLLAASVGVGIAEGNAARSEAMAAGPYRLEPGARIICIDKYNYAIIRYADGVVRRSRLDPLAVQRGIIEQ